MRWWLALLLVVACGCGSKTEEKKVLVTVLVYFNGDVRAEKIEDILGKFPECKLGSSSYDAGRHVGNADLWVPASLTLSDLANSIKQFRGVKDVKFE